MDDDDDDVLEITRGDLEELLALAELALEALS